MIFKRKITVPGKGEFYYHETTTDLREVMEKIRKEFRVSEVKYYDTWANETEITEPFNFYWIGTGNEIWLKVLVGFFEKIGKPGEKIVLCQMNEALRDRIKPLVEKHLAKYLEKHEITKVVEI